MARVLPIGLDIGGATVRMLQLGGSERDLRVIDAAKFPIPYEVRADAVLRREVVVGGIRRALKEHRFRRREVVMLLSPEQLAIRSIRMPKMPEKELATAVNWEAQNKFPFDTATAVIQYVRAGEVRQGEQVLDEVLLFAAPREEAGACGRRQHIRRRRRPDAGGYRPRAGHCVREDDSHRRGGLQPRRGGVPGTGAVGSGSASPAHGQAKP